MEAKMAALEVGLPQELGAQVDAIGEIKKEVQARREEMVGAMAGAMAMAAQK